MALSEIQKDSGLKDQLTKENLEELSSKLKDAEKGLPFKLLAAYRSLALLESEGVSWLDLGIPTIGARQTLTARVKEYLKDQERILSRITPKYILGKTFRKDEDEKTMQEIWEIFLKTPGLPTLESSNVLMDAIKEGVKTERMGAQLDDKVYFGESVSSFPDDISVLRDEKARALKGEEVEEGIKAGEVRERRREKWGRKGEVGVKTSEYNKVTIRARIPWDKLSDYISGVLSPLQREGAELSLEVDLSAESAEGISKKTLELKVRETLNQIGAEILEWPEE